MINPQLQLQDELYNIFMKYREEIPGDEFCTTCMCWIFAVVLKNAPTKHEATMLKNQTWNFVLDAVEYSAKEDT